MRTLPNLIASALLLTAITVESTAYCLTTTTKTGTKPRPGTIAVDPQVVPLGTRVYIPGYGYGVAEDTGGNIKGRRVDVWLPSRGACMEWGRRDVRMVLLEEESDVYDKGLFIRLSDRRSRPTP